MYFWDLSQIMQLITVFVNSRIEFPPNYIIISWILYVHVYAMISGICNVQGPTFQVNTCTNWK